MDNLPRSISTSINDIMNKKDGVLDMVLDKEREYDDDDRTWINKPFNVQHHMDKVYNEQEPFLRNKISIGGDKFDAFGQLPMDDQITVLKNVLDLEIKKFKTNKTLRKLACPTSTELMKERLSDAKEATVSAVSSAARATTSAASIFGSTIVKIIGAPIVGLQQLYNITSNKITQGWAEISKIAIVKRGEAIQSLLDFIEIHENLSMSFSKRAKVFPVDNIQTIMNSFLIVCDNIEKNLSEQMENEKKRFELQQKYMSRLNEDINNFNQPFNTRMNNMLRSDSRTVYEDSVNKYKFMRTSLKKNHDYFTKTLNENIETIEDNSIKKSMDEFKLKLEESEIKLKAFQETLDENDVFITTTQADLDSISSQYASLLEKKEASPLKNTQETAERKEGEKKLFETNRENAIVPTEGVKGGNKSSKNRGRIRNPNKSNSKRRLARNTRKVYRNR